ncbi:substrate-binding domain-containing protein [Microbacterium deminutum]|uniref:Transcriptional regulator LacI/GalR-like sensor domain-containing protein n=1 Tax=Microbacterium deminutum TaxID=344164 RepID=A0ABP5BEF5_9MICO
MISHLVELGHERIAQVVGPQTGAQARLRRALYQRVLRDHGLDDSWWAEGDCTAAGGRVATRTLLSSVDRPTAIVYSNDLMAIAGSARLEGRSSPF